MIRMFARRYMELDCAVGADRVFFGISLPSDSVIHDINLEVHLRQAEFLSVANVTMYAIEGWILPILDPDSVVNFNTLWDNLVPKDTDVENVNLDTTGADATPFFEAGEPDFSQMLDIGLRPERVWSSSRMLTISKGSVATIQDNQTPFKARWLPGTTQEIRIRKRFHVTQPSALVFAIANPSLDDTTATEPTAMAEDEWVQTKYIGMVLERAMLHLFGIVEAGAETPWEEATALLKKHLEPDVFEETAGNWAQALWKIAARGIVDHSVVGEIGQIAVTTGR